MILLRNGCRLCHQKSFHGFFDGLQNRFAILHALSRHPWLYIPWQERAKFPHWLYNNWQVLVKKCAFVSDSEFLLHIYSIEEIILCQIFQKNLFTS